MGAMAIPLAIGGAALQGATSFAGARAQNAAVRRSSDAILQNTRMQQQQLAQSGDLQRQQLTRQAQVAKQRRMQELAVARGRLRATGGSLGIGNLANLQMAAASSAGQDIGLIQEDYRNRMMAVNSQQQASMINLRSQAQSNLINLSARRRDPFMAAATGAFGGFGAGLNIGSALDQR